MDALRIYVDLDDVLAESARGFLEVLEADFGRQVAFDDLHAFDLRVSLGFDQQELQAFMRAVHDPDVLAGMEPMAGAAEVMGEWRKAGHEIRVVTGRPPECLTVSEQWLSEQRFPYDGLTFVDKYSRDLSDWTEISVVKLEDLAGHGFDFAIEDSGEVASYLAGELGMRVLLLDRPWNRSVATDDSPNGGKPVRCGSWDDIRRWVATRQPLS